MKQTSEHILAKYCHAEITEAEKPQSVESAITIKGISCSLMYDERIDLDQVSLFVAFGYPPHNREAPAYKELLQRNHLGFEGSAPGYCISPKTGKVGFVVHISLAETTLGDFATSLENYVDKAMEWKNTYFLEKDQH